MTHLHTDTALCEPQDMAGRLFTALSDLVRDCKARMLRPWSGHRPNADLNGFRLGITWLAQQRQMDSMLNLAEQLVREAPALVGGHGRKPETLDQLRACMVPVLRALPEINRPPAQRLEWLFGALLVDELQCMPQSEVTAVLDLNDFRPQHWQHVAHYLEQNLPNVKGTGLSWQGQERRRQLLGYAWQAYRKAGSADRAEALLRRELSVCACYGELAEVLAYRGDVEEAQRVLLNGVSKYNESRPELTMVWMDRLESLNGAG